MKLNFEVISSQTVEFKDSKKSPRANDLIYTMHDMVNQINCQDKLTYRLKVYIPEDLIEHVKSLDGFVPIYDYEDNLICSLGEFGRIDRISLIEISTK